MRPRRVGSGRRWGRHAGVVMVILLGATACIPVSKPPGPMFTPNPPIYDQDFPDPEVVRPESMVVPGDGDFRAISTNSVYAPGDWPRVPVARSATLKPESWARGVPPDALPEPMPSTWHATSHRGLWWAPAIAKLGETWVMYYTAPNASWPVQCIGAATSTTVDGPYEPFGSGPLTCDYGGGGSIDPSVVVDRDGQPWLLWKNDGNCCNLPTYIWSAPLQPDGLGFVADPAPILPIDQGWEDGSRSGREPWKRLIEGPAMIEADGAYWLFYSANWWESADYAIGYARCTSPGGGCTKPTNRPLVGTGSFGWGPGGPDVVTDASGGMWLAYHSWAPWAVGYSAGGRRALHVSRLSFVNGTPTLGANP